MDTFKTKYGDITLYKNDVYMNKEFTEGRYWDEDTLVKLKEFIDPKRDILEIGGHCGTSSLFYRTFLSPGQKVYVFEPQRNMFNLLCKNIAQNNAEPTIIPYNLGLFCTTGRGTMNYKDLDGGGGIIAKRYTEENHLPCNFGGVSLGANGEDIFMTTVDTLNYDTIGFIHCDAQGAEPFIFSKAIQTIVKCRPVILYENMNLYGKYLYNTICRTYPQYREEAMFDIKKFCMENLKYSKYIDRFNGGIDTLLLP